MTAETSAPILVASRGAELASARLSTCSYSGDFEVCRLLCESVDRFLPESIGHTLYVPERDRKLFAPLAGPRRRIESQESLLPRWLWKVPLPSPKWRARLRLPRRNVYLTPFGPPVRGWIAQQIMKIAAASGSDSEIVIHVDSDNVFVRPLRMEHLVRDGRVRFYRSAEKIDLATHRRWHSVAGRLLNLPPSDFYGAEFIDPLVVWRRSVTVGLTQRLAEVSGRDWRATLAREPHFAEYVLYGVFAEQALGLEAAGLFPTPRSLCHSLWEGGFADEAEENAFVAGLRPDHVVCLIQSTVAMATEERRRIFERVVAAAERQDQAPASETLAALRG